MRETRSYGSVRGVRSNPYPYRDHPTPGAEGTALRRTPLSPMIGAINPVRHTPAEAPLATSEFQEEMRN
jgi:hypothetical protein